MDTECDPILIIGVPRSGTTIVFEQFASHSDLAWLSNYSGSYPNWPSVNLLRRFFDNERLSLRGKKDQFGDVPWFNEYIPRPHESYPFWNTHGRADFGRSYLIGETATPNQRVRLRRAMEATRRFQGRARITAKLTGPGRISYLNSVWPNLSVINVVRDGLDVVRSLLGVNFWVRHGGLEKLWWDGSGLDSQYQAWQRESGDPAVLAAMQWRAIIETTRREAAACLGDRYMEVRYEDFLLNPRQCINSIYQRVGLSEGSANIPEFEARNRTYSDSWSDEYRYSLRQQMQPQYSELGYDGE